MMLRSKRQLNYDAPVDKYADDRTMDRLWKERTLRYADKANEYLRQRDESEAFDIDEDVLPSECNWFVSTIPIPNTRKFMKGLPIVEFCKAALDKYNENQRNDLKYEFKEFAYATQDLTRYITYNLTFHANTVKGNHPVVFQARVLDRQNFGKDEPHVADVKFCRIKAYPSVKDVQIVGDVLEGNIIKGCGHYIGGREGTSKFQWFRVNNDTRKTKSLCTGTKEYTVTKEDVGHRLLFKYTPVDSVDQSGKPIYKRSEIVKQGSPSVNNVSSVGDDVCGTRIEGSS